jgi:hypothetical protein
MWPHAFCADLKLGEPASAGVMRMATEALLPEVFTTGSGKPLTPWVRMHAEYWYASAPGPLVCGDSEPVDDDGGELAPQPAMMTPMAALASRTAAARRRGERMMSVRGI